MGALSVVVPDDVVHDVTEAAAAAGVSVDEFVVRALQTATTRPKRARPADDTQP